MQTGLRSTKAQGRIPGIKTENQESTEESDQGDKNKVDEKIPRKSPIELKRIRPDWVFQQPPRSAKFDINLSDDITKTKKEKLPRCSNGVESLQKSENAFQDKC